MNKQCKGYCSDFSGRSGGNARYGLGEKYCSRCEFVYLEDFRGEYCSCCGTKLKFARHPQEYTEDNYSQAFLKQIKRKPQCKWCKSFVSKFAQHRIYGKPTDPNSRIEFYQEWRTDKLGNQVCHDCWQTGISIDTLDQRLETFSKRLNELQIDIPTDFNSRIHQILALYPVKIEASPFALLSS